MVLAPGHDAQGFAQACDAAARQLRRMPKDLRRDLGAHVREQVARPLAQDVASAASGPWGPVLRAGVRVRSGADPALSIGGARRVLSGGGSVRSVVFGAEWGGGKRVRANRKGKQVKTTQQFVRNRNPFIYPTFRRETETVFTRWVDVLTPYLDAWEDR